MTQTDAKKVLTGIAPFLIQDDADIFDIATEAISNITHENATGIGSLIYNNNIRWTFNYWYKS